MPGEGRGGEAAKYWPSKVEVQRKVKGKLLGTKAGVCVCVCVCWVELESWMRLFALPAIVCVCARAHTRAHARTHTHTLHLPHHTNHTVGQRKVGPECG